LTIKAAKKQPQSLVPRHPPREIKALTTRLRLRILAVLAALLLAATGAATLAGVGPLADMLAKARLPLKDTQIIRQQSKDKQLDPGLVAAIIYQESRFKDQTSHAGALGLMQILPQTATFVAQNSGAKTFTVTDLSKPDVNIAYGTWYLQFLMRQYQGNTELAIAAYNAGQQNVDAWIRQAGGRSRFRVVDAPFAETREYVQKVLENRDQYRRHYSRELYS
jgi:soluble lytic murein transglycosylase